MIAANTSGVFAPVLERLRFDAATYYKRPTVHLVESQYEERPFSHVLRVDVHGDTTGPVVSRLFVKVVKAGAHGVEEMRERVVHDYETTLSVYRVMQSHGDLGVVPPVACYPDLLALVTEEVKGPTLLDHLTGYASWWAVRRRNDTDDVLGNVGRWIRVFQGARAAGEPGSPDLMRDYIDYRLQRLVRMQAADFDETARGRVLKLVDSFIQQIPAVEWTQVPVHSDMALGNILVCESGIVVLDFAMAKFGTRLQDVAHVFVQLDLLKSKPFIRAAAIRTGQASLLRGFDSTLTPDHPMFRLMVLRHRINHLVGLMDPERAFSEKIYNSMVAKRHYAWVRQEIDRCTAAVGRAK